MEAPRCASNRPERFMFYYYGRLTWMKTYVCINTYYIHVIIITSKTPRTGEQKRFWAVARAARSFQTLKIHIALTYFLSLSFFCVIDPKDSITSNFVLPKTTQNPPYLYLVLYFRSLQTIASHLMMCFKNL